MSIHHYCYLLWWWGVFLEPSGTSAVSVLVTYWSTTARFDSSEGTPFLGRIRLKRSNLNPCSYFIKHLLYTVTQYSNTAVYHHPSLSNTFYLHMSIHHYCYLLWWWGVFLEPSGTSAVSVLVTYWVILVVKPFYHGKVWLIRRDALSWAHQIKTF